MGFNPYAGQNLLNGFGLHVFSEDELYAIHCATLHVLQHTGIKILSKEAQDIYDGGGAYVERRTNMVKIPGYLVEDAIASAPKTLLLAGRNPKHDIVVEGSKVGFTNFGEGVMIIDPYTKEYRKTTKKDTGDIARVCDALDCVDVHERAVSAQDVPSQVAPLHEVEVNFTNTSKHLFQGCGGVKNLRKIIDMAAAVVGGRDKLRERPIYSCITCPVSPLQLVPESTDVIVECAREGIPMNILSMALAGGTSPVTLSGTLVTHNAEVLGGIVLSQLSKKGAPVIYGSSTTIMDMKYTTSPVGCPELGMINAAVAKMAQYYLLPSWVAGG
jgi:trimethylamine--corrinoid protein Co-methyltransferase